MINFTKIKIKSNNLGEESLVPDFKGGGSVPNLSIKTDSPLACLQALTKEWSKAFCHTLTKRF
ncbi:MAG: hypothetical protein IKA85_00235 [Clostridia bacterium]|nr:hypothetical protein [Clostridia bacterium]